MSICKYRYIAMENIFIATAPDMLNVMSRIVPEQMHIITGNSTAPAVCCVPWDAMYSFSGAGRHYTIRCRNCFRVLVSDHMG